MIVMVFFEGWGFSGASKKSKKLESVPYSTSFTGLGAFGGDFMVGCV